MVLNLINDSIYDHSIQFKTAAVNCEHLKMVSYYCCALFVLSLVFNSLILILAIRYRSLLNAQNIFIFALCVLNIFATFGELPFVIISNYNCKWAFDKKTCVLSAFFMYFTGCTSVYLMVAISIERYLIIIRII